MPARVFVCVCVCDVVASTKAPNRLQHKIGDHSFIFFLYRGLHIYIYILFVDLYIHWSCIGYIGSLHIPRPNYYKHAHFYIINLWLCIYVYCFVSRCLWSHPHVELTMLQGSDLRGGQRHTETQSGAPVSAFFCFDALRFFWLVVNQVPCNNSM